MVGDQTSQKEQHPIKKNYNLLEEILQLISGEENDRFAQALRFVLNEAMKIDKTEALEADLDALLHFHAKLKRQVRGYGRIPVACLLHGRIYPYGRS